MADITFKTVDNTKWEKLAPLTTKAPDKYVAVLDALESGEILEIETKDAKEAKGVRIAIGRKASARGFKAEYRVEGNTLYVKKNEEKVQAKEPKEKEKKKKEAVA